MVLRHARALVWLRRSRRQALVTWDLPGLVWLALAIKASALVALFLLARHLRQGP